MTYLKCTHAAALAFAAVLYSAPLFAQGTPSICGHVVDAIDGDALVGVHVAVWDSSLTSLLTGSISDSDGAFSVDLRQHDDVYVRISAVGYHPIEYPVSFSDARAVDLGRVELEPAWADHEEVFVDGERMLASRRGGSTVYHVSDHMAEAVPSGVEMLRMVPGVHVDLMRKVTIEGSDRIIVIVDGRERDVSFLAQLASQDVASIEIIQPPSAGFPADITAVMRIRLHARNERHLSGHFHAEIPTSMDEVYAFPSYRVAYGRGATTLFTAYNAEITRFNVEANSVRDISGLEVRQVTQRVRQRNWSHRFHYGLDHAFSRRTNLSLYGQLNPNSFEQNGSLLSDQMPEDADRRTERDSAIGTYHAVTLQHAFDDERNHHLALDLSLFTYARQNETTFGSRGTVHMPRQRQFRARADYARPLSSTLTARTGVSSHRQSMGDGTNDGFSYDDATNETYVSLTADVGVLEVGLGLTGAYHRYGYGSFKRRRFDLNPQLTVALASPIGRQIRISGRRSVPSPHLYQINPTPWSNDPFTIRRGDPTIRPSERSEIALDVSGPVGSSFLSTGVYFALTDNAIQMLIAPDGDGVIETAHNVGKVREYGARLSGSVRLGSFGGVQPSARLYHVKVESDASVEDGPSVRQGAGAEVGISAFATFGPGYTLALSYQREGRGIELHRSYQSDALYFLSIGRTFGNGLKLDIASGLPFARRFTYRGQEITAPNVVGRTNDFIRLSAVPVLVHLTYTFSRGQERTAPQVREVDLPVTPRSGM